MTISLSLTQDYTGFAMSEKLDGVRAVWDGEKFISKNGKTFNAPQSWIDSMPKGITLDGELWLDRGKFQETISKVRSGDFDGLKYVIFDADIKGNFWKRQKAINELSLPCFAKIISQIKIENEDHLESFKNCIETMKGEGVIIRNPKTAYEKPNYSTVIKMKPKQTDEALVISRGGKVEFNGVIFKLDARCKLEIGQLVTFEYSGFYKSGKPRFANFLAVRDYE